MISDCDDTCDKIKATFDSKKPQQKAQKPLALEKSSLTSPQNNRKPALIQAKSLTMYEDIENSVDTIKSVTEEEGTSLLKQIAVLQSMGADYKEYFIKIQTKLLQEQQIARVNYEREFNALDEVARKLLSVVRDYEETLSLRMTAAMIKQQRQLSEENKEVGSRIAKVSEKKGEAEAMKQIEEEKIPDKDAGFKVKENKEKISAIAIDFEKLLKFKPKNMVWKQEADITSLPSDTTIFRIQQSEEKKFLSPEQNFEMSSLCEKMQEIKHPIVAFFQYKAKSCTISKYSILRGQVKTETIPCDLEIDIRESETITHPNGSTIYFVCGGQIAVYDSSNKVFLKKPSNLSYIGVQKCSVVLLDNNIYVMGGKKEESSLSSTYRYNIITDKWSHLARLNVGRYNSAGCVLNESQICVAGGENEITPTLDSIEILNVHSNIWEICSLTMKIPRKCFTISSIEREKLIICGGISAGKDIVKTAEELDIAKNVAIVLPTPTQCKRGAKSFGIGSALYVVGGIGETEECLVGEVYNLRKGKWEPIPEKQKELTSTLCPAGVCYD